MRSYTGLLSEIEYPWVLGVLAKNEPDSHIFGKVLQVAEREMGRKNRRGHQVREWLREFQEGEDPEMMRIVATARWVALASWLQSGSPLISLDADSAGILDTLKSPRFHALTLPAGSPDNARTYAINLPMEDCMYSFFVWASVSGPVVHAICLVDEGEGQGGELGVNLDLCGAWDEIRWHEQSKKFSSEINSVFTRVINAVAAIEESREVLRRPKKSDTGKKRKKRLIRRKGRAVTYRLDQNALDAWVERVARSRPMGPVEPVQRGESGPRRIHECREHTRRLWVSSPAEGEAVLGVREGRRGQLFRVKRTVKKHVRGSVVEPKTLKLTVKAEK